MNSRLRDYLLEPLQNGKLQITIPDLEMVTKTETIVAAGPEKDQKRTRKGVIP